ncbi:MAG TPA: dTDP-4-dehydrorhamnose reductase [Chthoniobacterales bacterium]|jgi:dTDP-4-dehydrorhamnose reductase
MRIVIVGAGGRLGGALAREYAGDFDVRGFRHADLNLADSNEIRERLCPIEFELLINCAALTNVDYCESHREEAFSINAAGPDVLAKLCAEKNAKLIHISTDYVFDGKKQTPYLEEDKVVPLSIYGQSKREGELRALAASKRHLVARVSWVFGPDRPSFVDQVIQRARETADVAAIADKFAVPTYTLDLALWLRAAWERDLVGLLHLANGGECSWQEYAQYALDCCHEDGVALMTKKVGPLTMAEVKNFIAQRPVYTVLSTAKFTDDTGISPRNWREAVAEYIGQYVAKK